MPSSYSSLLRTEMVAIGEQADTWGTTNNKNIGTLLEAAVAGIAGVVMTDADYTLTALNGVSDEARSMGLIFTGTLTAARNVICPTSTKKYVVKNGTAGGFAIMPKTLAGTGISVPNGAWATLLCDGTNIVSVALATVFTSAQLAAAVSDETGAGALVFGTSPTIGTATLNSPTLVTPALGTPASGTLTSCTGLPVATGVSGLGAGVATFLATPSSANLAAAVTDETGTGALVLATSPTITSPTLVAPAIGTPASGTLTSCTGLPIATGVSGLGVGSAAFLATPSSANLAAAVTDETGSGALVFANTPVLVDPAVGTQLLTDNSTKAASTAFVQGVAFSTALPSQAGNSGKLVTTDGANASWTDSPTLVTPALGTPASGTLTNCTGLPAAGVVGTALVSAAIGTTVQAYDADLTTWAGVTPGTGVATALAVAVGSAGALVANGGALGTPSSGVATNLTGTAAGLTAGNVTTNANLTGHITSVGNAAVLGSFTVAQLNTAISDADVATGGGTATGTNTGDQTAATVANTPAGSIAATTVQAAINELDTEKAALAGSASQTFSVAAATAAAHAVRYDQTLGIGQTWQDVLASRAFNTTYTNTTSKPITVNIFATGDATAVMTATTQGVILYGSAMGAGSVTNSIMFIVAPGAGYIVNQSVTAGQTLYAWSELR